jgi:TolB-like protein
LVGRELGARYVLEGSVRKAGNRSRLQGVLERGARKGASAASLGLQHLLAAAVRLFLGRYSA